MKKLFLTFILFFVMGQLALGTTYYLRADGTCIAANKANATVGCGGAVTTVMNLTQHNACTFAAGDNIVLCDSGGSFTDVDQMIFPSSGTAGNLITYTASGTPVIDGANVLSSWTSEVVPQSGSVTQANMRLSLVNGTSFVDFGVAGTLAPYAGDLITITDSVGGGTHQITGYIKAVGTTESYGSELLPNTTFANTTNIGVSGATVGVASNQLTITTTSGFGDAVEAISVTSGMLVRTYASLKLGTCTSEQILIQENGGSYNWLTVGASQTPANFTQYTIYGTADMASLNITWGVYAAAGSVTGLVTTPSAQQVTAPSSKGVTITSTSNGATYNWASIGGSFNYNDSSGYTYTISGAPSFTAYYATLATSPVFVSQSGTYLTAVAAKTLLTPGTFWFDSPDSRIYVRTTGDDATSNYTMKASVRPTFTGNSTLIDFNGKSYITVNGITVVNSQYFGIRSYAAADGVTNQTIQNSNISYCGGGGIILSADTHQWSNGLISGNTVHHINQNQLNGYYEGITMMYGTGMEITNNTVHDFANLAIDIHGGSVGGHPSTTGSIHNNTVYGADSTLTSMAGIYIDGATNIDVYSNYVHGVHFPASPYAACMQVNSEIAGNVDTNIRIFYNIFTDCDVGSNFLDQAGSTMTSISYYNNDFTNMTTYGMLFTSSLLNNMAGTNNFQNNIFYGNPYDIADGTTGKYATNHMTIGYNFFPTGDTTDTKGSNYVQAASPLFTNGSGNLNLASDFTLKPTSPCLSAGTYTCLYKDYFGTLIPLFHSDIGAYQTPGKWTEYQGVSIKGGVVH